MPDITDEYLNVEAECTRHTKEGSTEVMLLLTRRLMPRYGTAWRNALSSKALWLACLLKEA